MARHCACIILISFLTLLLTGCTQPEKQAILFRDHSPESSGIAFNNELSSTPELNILNYIYFYNGAGVAAADFNGDGWQDLYFTSNQGADHLYLNNGDWVFERVDAAAGIRNEEGWTTGVSVADVNADGRLDIYVSKLDGHLGITGHNKLYINQGNDANGIPQFLEQAELFGLDFRGYSTQANFFDYDLDGDLDLFLLNHSTNPNQNYGNGRRRSVPDHTSGDKLFENRNGQFVDVSQQAGIFQSKFGYGLGVSVGDLNNDGWPDIYITNDFYENDYLYINRGDGAFDEVIHTTDGTIGHTSHFAMGKDIGDVNNDGWNDIVALDMLPEDLVTYKSSGMEFSYPIYANYIRNGYAHQYMQNTLQLNGGGNHFSEIGYLSGIAASEWSWSPLLADFDLDGMADLFISNGILGATNDMDFISFIANEEIQRSLSKGVEEQDLEFIKSIPPKKVPNYFYRNSGGLQFEDVGEKWSNGQATYSNGAVRVDLDNDGDLDLVVNNVNAPASLLENTAELRFEDRHWLKVRLSGDSLNPFGVGSRISLYQSGKVQTRELFPVRGYLSTQPHLLHFGLGNEEIDSVSIRWPDGGSQTLYAVQPDQELELVYDKSRLNYTDQVDPNPSNSEADKPFIDFVHKDNTSLEFNRDPLVPYALSNEGPCLSVADINADGRDDLFIGGGKGQPAALWTQSTDGKLELYQQGLFDADAISEDTASLFFDADGDGDSDLLVASGGNEFKSGKPLQPRLYVNNEGTFSLDTLQFTGISINAASISSVDVEMDGDIDLLITADASPGIFGSTPRHYLFTNDGMGQFTDSTQELAPELNDYGSITDAQWGDMDGDGDPDLVVAGLWSAVGWFRNDSGSLSLQESAGLDKSHGWWKSLELADLDGDGDMDIVAGNWGLNSRLTADADQPLRLYRSDFDNNGKEEPIVTYFYKGQETVIASKDELVKQLPGLNKSFLSYSDFARASVEDLFGKDKLRSATRKEVYELASCYFEQVEGGFVRHRLPLEAQVSSVNDIGVWDFDKDGNKDLYLVGNNFEISTQLSRLDASYGLLLMGSDTGEFQLKTNPLFTVVGAARALARFDHLGTTYWVVARNNLEPAFLRTE